MEELLKKILLEEYSGPMGWTRDAKEESALELLESVKGVAEHDEKAWDRLYGVLVRLAKESTGTYRTKITDKRDFKEQLVGAAVLGIDFRGTLEAHNRPGWNFEMDPYVGMPGTIECYNSTEDAYKVRFRDGEHWWYPARLIILQFC